MYTQICSNLITSVHVKQSLRLSRSGGYGAGRRPLGFGIAEYVYACVNILYLEDSCCAVTAVHPQQWIECYINSSLMQRTSVTV